jgi:crotonobetainyl-CoA:carnitine CoA-transferase CaiB-like acyl-CoA transferase
MPRHFEGAAMSDSNSAALRPLAGVRVVDLADGRGELCGRLLADLGADVLRIERPGGGASRGFVPLHAGVSLHFAWRNANKRGATLDVASAAGRARLAELLASCDVLLESAAPSEARELGLAPDDVAAQHPHLVHVSLTDFGQHGPYRDWVATDAVLEAMSGMIFKAGIPSKPPLLPPVPLAHDVASVTAAFATLLALWQRRASGHGQHLDFSLLLGMAQTTDWSFPNASLLREKGLPVAELRNGSGPVYTIYKCKGGYVRLVVLSPRQWRAMWEWLGKPEEFADPHWEGFVARLMNADLLTKRYEAHFAELTMEEVSAEAQRRGIVCTPVLRPSEVLENVHLRSRGTFVEAEVAPGVSGPVASGFLSLDGERLGFRTPAPRPGQDDLAEFTRGAERRAAPRGPRPAPALPLAGLRVLDFGIGGVGVEAGRLFAEYGADVVKIETRSYPDFMRTVTGSWTSPSFASSSRSKRSFGVNVKQPEGLAALKELIRHADVIIENSATGTLADMGVGWETVRVLNPRLVMVSSQLLGSRGAWKDWIGYGPSTQPLGGLVHLWNYADQDFPAGSGAIFPDHLAGRICALAALAALLRRERTGAGGHAEVAQIEAVTGMLAELLLKEGLAPGSVQPRGNASDQGAPWGVYPCAGEQQWCAITIRDDAEWRRLCEAIDDAALARDARFASAAGRLAARGELDERVAAFTRTLGKRELAALLQHHHVPCGSMFAGTDQLDDPHYQAWGYARFVEQPTLGRMAFEGPAFAATGMSDVVVRPAPELGEHTREIARTLLGMSEARIDALVASGALEDPPPPRQAQM